MSAPWSFFIHLVFYVFFLLFFIVKKQQAPLGIMAICKEQEAIEENISVNWDSFSITEINNYPIILSGSTVNMNLDRQYTRKQMFSSETTP